jgi:hypothetical protein
MKLVALTDKQSVAIQTMIDEIRNGKITRFGGGSSVFDFKLNRADAFRRVQQLLEEMSRAG